MEEQLTKAKVLQKSGKYSEAEKEFVRLINQNDGLPEGYYHLGIFYLQTGAYSKAAACFEKCLNSGFITAGIYNNLGMIYQNNGDFEKSTECYKKAVEIEPGNIPALNNLAFACFQDGNLSGAVSVLNKAISLVPNDTESRYNLAYIYHQSGDLGKAEENYRAAINLAPDHRNAKFNIGLLLIVNKNFDEAGEIFGSLLEQYPDDYEAGCNYALCLAGLNKYEKSEEIYRKMFELNPGTDAAYFGIGNLYKVAENFHAALEAYKSATEINPSNYEAWNNSGLIHLRNFNYTSAEECFNRSLQIKPDYTDSLINLASLYYEMEQPERSIPVYEKAIASSGDNDDIKFNMSVALLLSGKMEDGFKEYEFRKSKLENDKKYKRIWKGESLSGKRLLVADEQGIGDTIQFIRFLKILKAKGAFVIFHCRKTLIPMMSNLKFIDEIIDLADEYHDYDFAVSLMSLVNLLRISPDKFADETPYFKLTLPEQNKYKRQLDSFEELKIGIVWKGNPKHKYDYKRSAGLEYFQGIVEIPGIKLFSLQADPEKQEIELLNKYGIIKLFEENDGFTNTFDLISGLDLIITVDTSIAHLAGAMGKNVWTLLPFGPDWRWQLRKEKTDWYPDMKLFRQKSPGKWEDVFETIKRELYSIIDNGSFSSQIFLQKKLRTFEYHENGNFKEAEKGYLEILIERPFDAETLFWLGTLYLSTGNYKPAGDVFSRLIEIYPGYNEEAYRNLVKVFIADNRNNEAETVFEKALEAFPASFEMANNYGAFLMSSGNDGKSVQFLKKAIELNPDFYDARLNLAQAYEKIQNFDDAIKEYSFILGKEGENKIVLRNIANCFLKVKNFENAEKYYLLAEKFFPGDSDILNNMAFALQRQNKLDKAGEYLFRALETSEKPGISYNLGNNFYLKNDFKKAEEFYLKAISSNQDYKEPKISLGFIRLSEGNFDEGWQYFAHSLIPNENLVNSGIPEWKGENLNGKTLLVYSEQGIGDNIHFARYIKIIGRLGGKIRFLCGEELASIILDDFVGTVSKLYTKDLAGTDYYCSLLKLPLILNKLGINDHSPVNFVKINNDLADKYKTQFTGNRLNVGLVWKGNPQHQFDYNRSVKLEFFNRIFENREINFYSLQLDSRKEIQPFLPGNPNLADLPGNFEEKVAIIQNLDLIISVDTMIAHLAATMGKPVWLLLSAVSDWRWMRNTTESYLYPTVKLFRQKELGDWSGVFNELETELKKMMIEDPYESEERAMISGARNAFEKTDHEKAEILLKHTISRYPDSEEAYLFLGYVYQVSGNLSGALECYMNVVRINPGNFNAYSNMGVVLKDLKKFDEAEKCLEISIKLNDQNSVAFNNLAIISHLKGDFENAFLYITEALKLNPDYQEALINLSNYYDYKGDFENAKININKAIDLNPESVDARFNKALILLRENYSREAWEEYEWRKGKPGYQHRKYGLPELKNKDIHGKRILVYDEQGFGDTIQFARYLNIMKESGAYVILECHKSLVELMKTCPGIDEVFPRGEINTRIYNIDYQAALLSLPLILFDTVSQIPGGVPYFKIDRLLKSFWHENYASSNDFKIGIVWRGKQPVTNLQRSAKLEFFEDIVKLENVKLFSLQKEGVTETDKEFMSINKIVDLSGNLNTFKDTAEIISGLDLVITIDTAVAHLSGAVGAKTWVMLSTRSDWRWYLGTDKNPWYPTMKIFRQETYNNWNSIFNKMKTELNNEIKNHQ